MNFKQITDFPLSGFTSSFEPITKYFAHCTKRFEKIFDENKSNITDTFSEKCSAALTALSDARIQFFAVHVLFSQDLKSNAEIKSALKLAADDLNQCAHTLNKAHLEMCRTRDEDRDRNKTITEQDRKTPLFIDYVSLQGEINSLRDQAYRLQRELSGYSTNDDNTINTTIKIQTESNSLDDLLKDLEADSSRFEENPDMLGFIPADYDKFTKENIASFENGIEDFINKVTTTSDAKWTEFAIACNGCGTGINLAVIRLVSDILNPLFSNLTRSLIIPISFEFIPEDLESIQKYNREYFQPQIISIYTNILMIGALIYFLEGFKNYCTLVLQKEIPDEYALEPSEIFLKSIDKFNDYIKELFRDMALLIMDQRFAFSKSPYKDEIFSKINEHSDNCFDIFCHLMWSKK